MLLMVIFIAFLFPTGARFDLDYTKGEIWRHDDLLAPFEFPLLKNEKEIALASDNAKKYLIPTFKLNSNKGKVHTRTSKYVESIAPELEASSLNQLNAYIGQNNSKLLISKEQLIVDGQQKGVFNIIQGNAKKSFAKSDYIFIEDYYRTISSLLPPKYHATVGNLISVEAEIDQKTTQAALNAALQKGITTNKSIKNGELIVSKGNLISETVYAKLNSLEDAFAKKDVNFIDGLGSFMGYIMLTFLILAALVLYIYFHFPSILSSPKEFGFILLWIAIFSFLVFQIERNDSLSAYMIPFCIAPIVIKTYYEERLALFVHIVIVLIASFLCSLGYEFTFMQILAGIVTVLLIEETRYWDRFFLSILIIIATYFLGFLGLNLADTNDIASGVDSSVFKWLGINGVLILLAYPFIPLISKIFGFSSSITLTELADLNKPLLRNLSLNAPGTFQHSLQVSNLSEAAAEKIGADSLLVKVSALYHDIGKLKNPELFIENQKHYNPHEKMSYFDSARGIIEHVDEGVKMAKNYGLPEAIIDIIKSHHGTTRVEYFYRKQLSDFPEQEFDLTLFEYEGPKPITREETILMMSDSIEAASKSLKQPTGHDIDQLVDKIVNHKMENGQLSESKLSFEELALCKAVYKDLLRNINHVRVEYPDEPKAS